MTSASKTILDELTALVITFNEEENIARTLDSLSWVPQILVVDSYSTDSTLELARQFSQVVVIQRDFKDFADQCNFGLETIKTKWVLSVDADYLFPGASEKAIEQAMQSDKEVFSAEFDYCISGKPVRGGILPPRHVLFRKRNAKYENDGHGHRVIAIGERAELPFKIRHDDRKPLTRWCHSQVSYAKKEAHKLGSSSLRDLSLNDRIRRLIFVAPPAVFLYVYIYRGGFLSGWKGLYYALQRLVAECLLSLFLIENLVLNKKE